VPLRVLWILLVCLGLWLGAWSCGGPSHCGYNAGDATCAGRDPGTPFCNLCIQDNDGCVAVPPIDSSCVLAVDSSGFDSIDPTFPLTDPTTTDPDPDPTTTTQGPGSSLETTDPTFPQTTSTTNPTTVSTTETTNATTDVSTSSSETTADDTTGSTSSSTGGSSSTTSDDTTSGSSGATSDDTTGPPPPMCGNDAVEGMELCDGVDLDGKKCTDFPGKGGGTLACTAMCQFNLGGCCLANNQACNANGDCCINSCKFDLIMAKKICKP
jgi:hypothetical protein